MIKYSIRLFAFFFILLSALIIASLSATIAVYLHLKILAILWLAFLSLAVFGALVWLIVGKCSRGIKLLTNAIKDIDASHLKTVKEESMPMDMRPLVEELNRLFLQVQEVFLREERFTSDAAHELRTPLAALRAHTHVALHATSKKERDSALRKVNEGIERSSHVINQLLILNRAIRPKANQPKAEPVFLNKEAKTVIAELFTEVQKKHINIKLIAPRPHPVIIGYPTAISILIRNLVDNSIRYAGDDSSITVSIGSRKKQAILKVIDNGPGIPENLRKQVFNRFFRIADSSIQGSGLGLNIVQQIAKQHNANIELLTPPSGKGLEVDVIFKLPSRRELKNIEAKT